MFLAWLKCAAFCQYFCMLILAYAGNELHCGMADRGGDENFIAVCVRIFALSIHASISARGRKFAFYLPLIARRALSLSRSVFDWFVDWVALQMLRMDAGRKHTSRIGQTPMQLSQSALERSNSTTILYASVPSFKLKRSHWLLSSIYALGDEIELRCGIATELCPTAHVVCFSCWWKVEKIFSQQVKLWLTCYA